jgi:hypothetical protein
MAERGGLVGQGQGARAAIQGDGHEDRAADDIQGLLVDDYAHYTNVLRRVSYRYKMARAFISGSAADYSPWEESKALQLVQGLSRTLIEAGFGIVSGYGLGIGPYVLNGVFEQLDVEGTRSLDDRIVLRPFPIAIPDPAQRKRRWTAYREDMLTYAGVALFLFGNKRDVSGAVVAADGMEEEFKLAVAKGLFVVPLGCTGSTASVLHQRVLDNFDSYYPVPGYRRHFEDLDRQGTAIQVIKRVMTLLTKLRDDKTLHGAK